ncbi:MAG: hypothetical protein MI739_09300 [Bacteroidales bacterium]|nr:hypothetical protein [Bacteroidales bacterium]
MASCRDIKKDINFLAEQIMNECFCILHYSSMNNYEHILNILHEVENARLGLLHKVNHFPKKGSLKKYFKEIIAEMYERNLNLLDEVNKLSEA